jgi:hypothetical protein
VTAEIAYAAMGAALLLGFILGYGVRLLLSKNPLTKPVAPQELSQFLDRIVNQEEAEARRNEIRRMMHDSGRRTMRLDGGKPAKVHKMRRRRKVLRTPPD